MFKGNGYNEDIDWWCVGVTFYECVYKKVKIRLSGYAQCLIKLNRDHGPTAIAWMN